MRTWGRHRARCLPQVWARVLCAVLLAGLSTAAAGAAAVRWASLTQPMLHRVGPQQGLPNTVVTAIAQDHQGFLWVGTQGGLSRWDGYRFRNYSFVPGDPHALPDNYVIALLVDREGRLWVGTASGGLARYVPEEDGFVTYNEENAGLANLAAMALAEDGAGGLWIGSDQGLDHMLGVAEPAHTRIVHVPRLDDVAGPAMVVKSLLYDAHGTLWVGTRRGMARLNAGASRFVPVRLPMAGKDVSGVEALHMDSEGRLWVGTDGDGVFVLDPDKGSVRRFAATPEAAQLMRRENVSAIAEPVRGEIWITSFAGGGAVIDRASGTVRRFGYDARAAASSLASDTVHSLFSDRAGTLWLATDNGVGYYLPTPAALSLTRGDNGRPGLSDGDVMSLAVAADQQLWAGFARSGADLVDPEQGRVRPWQPGRVRHNGQSPSTSVTAMLAERDAVWLATPSGLYRSDQTGANTTRVNAPWLEDRWYVRALAGSDERLWLATSTDGLFQARYRPGQDLALVRHYADLNGLEVTTVCNGPQGSGFVWVGTTHGLSRIDVDRGTVLQRIGADPANPAALSNAYVSALHLDRRGRLWVGSNGGLDLLEGQRFRRLGLAQGLPDLNIDALAEDNQGRIWASTDQGVAVIDGDSLGIDVLGPAEGVLFAPYWGGAGAVTARGEILFGGTGGVTVLRPEHYRPWTLQPPVVVSEIRLGGKAVPAAWSRSAEGLLVQAAGNSFAVEFAALDYTAPQHNRYAYRLEGYDRDWIYTDAAHRVASYTNLPPGQYRLLIQGSNRRGVWMPRPLQIPVQVLPWWYQTLWFRAVLALLIATALYGAYRLRTWRLAQRQQALEREVAARTAEVLQQKTLAEQRHREASERNAELATVNTVAQILAGKLDLDKLIALVGDQLCSTFHGCQVRIALLEHGGALAFRYVAGEPSEAADSICRRVADTGQSELIAQGRQWLLGVPIIADALVRGALAVQRREPYQDGDQRLLQTVTAHLGAALQNALLFRQAEAARARAEEATQAKSMFLAKMSHEIRTPMNAVIGLSHLALNTTVPSRQRDYMQKVHSAGQSLLGIINDILDFSKIEAGKLDIETADFDLDALLAHVAAVGGGGAGRTALECNFDVPADVPRALRGDALRLGQVLINLLSNAFKFTERGELVLAVRVVERQATQARLAFSVRDTGIGMTDEQMGRLFQAFTQVDGSATRKFGGAGLGLSICKHLTTLMGGTIGVESRAGVGSCFTVELWLAYAAAALPLPPLPPHGLRVLVVDDNAHARAALLGMLGTLGVDALALDGSASAFSLARAGARFDLMLISSHLQRATRGRHHAEKTVVLAACAEDGAASDGVDASLVKPVTRGALTAVLQQLFGTEAPVPEAAPYAAPRFSGARVLLVEDNPINQEVASGLLEACGIQVELAVNGNDALARLQAAGAGHYQLVFMDLHMPELDGHAATARLRQDRRYDALPVIAMSANALPEVWQRCRQEGFNDHIGKPLLPAALYCLLQHYLPDVAPVPAGRMQTLPNALPGLDLAHGRLGVNGDDALLLKLLRWFRRDEHDSATRIRAALAHQDHVAAIRHAHTLRALAAGIGAAEVAQWADMVEHAIRQRAAPGVMLDALEQALVALCASLDNGLPPTPPPTTVEARAPQEWHEPLRRLAALLQAGDAAAISTFTSCAAEFEATFGSWDREALQRSLDRRDYDGAHAALQWVMHKHELAS